MPFASSYWGPALWPAGRGSYLGNNLGRSQAPRAGTFGLSCPLPGPLRMISNRKKHQTMPTLPFLAEQHSQLEELEESA